MKKYINPISVVLRNVDFEEPLCVIISDTEHPTDPILAPHHPEEEEVEAPASLNFWEPKGIEK